MKVMHLIVYSLFISLFILTGAHAIRHQVPFNFDTIQEAVDMAGMGDTVLVQPGRYPENINLNAQSVCIASRYILTGDEQDIAETVIHGGINGSSTIGIRMCNGVEITGFTLTGGDTDFGGGIYCRESTAIFSHLIVEENHVSRNGAGIYCTQGSTVTISDCIMRNNSCGYVGSGFGCYGRSEVYMSNCEIYGNYSDHVGGGLHCHSATLHLDKITVYGNSALHSGGALYVTADGQVDMVNSIFRENEPYEVYIMIGVNGTRFKPSFSVIDGGAIDIVAADPELLEWGMGNIDADPVFRNAEEGDFNLAQDSPCIDMGNPESSPDPDGTMTDIGRRYFHQDDGGRYVLHVPDGYATIQSAIEDANDGDVVLVQPGEYNENISYGGRNITVGSRILSTGSKEFIAQTIINADRNGAVARFEGESHDAMLTGFTLTNGECVSGGGICGRTSQVVLQDLLITGNIAETGGGISFISADQRGPSIHRVTVIDNHATDGAGGLYLEQQNDENDLDETLLDNIIIRGNQADNGCGGMEIIGGRPELRSVDILENSARSIASGLYCLSAEPVLNRVLIADNYSDAELPGILFQASNPACDRITVSGNLSQAETGGIVLTEGSQAVFTNSIIWDNTPPGINLEDDGNSFEIAFSNVMDGENAFIVNGESEVIYDESNMVADPMFTDAENGDYHLTEDSPCIDSGNPESDRDTDGSITEMGRYFYPQEFDFTRVFNIPEDFETIQEAINVSQQGDTIIVQPGRYVENLEFKGQPVVIGSLFMLTRDSEYITSTIIDGGETGVCVKVNRNEWTNAVVCGFTLTNGSSREGGAMFIYNSSPTIDHCLITGNTAEEGGAAVYSYGGGPVLKNCTITGNRSENGAGAFHLKNMARCEIINSIVYYNEPIEVVSHADLDRNSIIFTYSNLEGGEDGVVTNWNCDVAWEEGNITDAPMFADADNGDYHLDANSPCINAGDLEIQLDPDGSRSDMGAFPTDDGSPEMEFVLNMSSGWNLISTPVPPVILDLGAIWTEVVADGNLLLVKNQRGRFYRPDQDFNGIHVWDVRYGYWALLSEADQLNFVNRPVDQGIPIPLSQGWSIVSYFPEDAVYAEVAFQNIENELTFAKDHRGRFFAPEYGFSNMQPLRRGFGYQVKVSDDVDLVWSVPDNFNVDVEPAEKFPVHFIAVLTTDRNMSVLFNAPEYHILSDNSVSAAIPENWEYAELGVFTESGLCVGAVVLESFCQWGLAVWGDDPSTERIDGAKEGEELFFRVWNFKDEFTVCPEWNSGDGTYHTDGFLRGEIEFRPVPLTFELKALYPNPFNSRMNISYNIAQPGAVKLTIYDISGRTLITPVNAHQEYGSYGISLSADTWSSGVYFVRLESAGEIKMAKICCIK